MTADSITLAMPGELLDAVAERVVSMLIDRGLIGVTDADPWLDVDAAAAHLACKPKRIYDLVSAGPWFESRRGRLTKSLRCSLF